MLKSIDECYRILGISATNDKEIIKAAFRQNAFHSHPDVQTVSSRSDLDFILLRSAYETLMVFVNRLASNTNSERGIGTKSQKKWIPVPVQKQPVEESFGSKLSQQFNWLIWDIEDLFRLLRKTRNRNYAGQVVERDILKTLITIDKDILVPCGFHDNFMIARKLGPIDPESYLSILGTEVPRLQHVPYTSVENYFFDIRLRMNRLLGQLSSRPKQVIETLGDDSSFMTLMNSYQRCVYCVGRIAECIVDDKVFQNDFAEVKELAVVAT